MRPRHAIVLIFLISGCSTGAEAPASPSASASAPASAPVQATPSASDVAAEPDWSALPDLGAMVTATAPITAAFPGRYTSATDDGLWIPNGNAGAPAAVVRLDRDTLEVTAVIDLGGQAGAFPPDAEATAPSANGIWVTLGFQRAVALVDPQTNTETRRIAVDGNPYGLVEDGQSLWVVDYGGLVLKIDIATGDELVRVRNVPGPTGVAVGMGSIWVADHDLGNIVRLDPATGDVLATIQVGRRAGVTIGFGSVWARSDDAGTVSRIDPATNEVAATISMPTNPADLEIVGDSVWVTTSPQRGACERNSYLVRIDPDSNEVDGIMDLPCAAALVTDGTHLWAGSTDDGETSLIRLDVGTGP